MRLAFLLLPFTAMAVLQLSVPAQAQAPQKGLSFSLQSKITNLNAPDKDGRPGKKDTQVESRIVTLFPDVIVVKGGQSDDIYDFKKRKLVQIYPATSTYSVTSLYAIPAFNEMEKANRAMLGRTLSKAMPQDGTSPVAVPEAFDLDMMFGGPTNPEDSKGLESSRNDMRVTYKFRGQDVAAFTNSGTPVPAALKASYARFLAYFFTLHPYIKGDMKTGNAFSSLRFTNYSLAPAQSDKSYSVTNLRDVTETIPVIPAGFKFQIPKQDRLSKLLQQQPPAQSAQGSIDQIKKLHAEKKFTDLTLVFLGHSLAYGSEKVDQLKPIMTTLMQDAPPESRVREIFGLCSRQPSGGDLQKKIDFLSQMQKYFKDHGYFLGGCLALYQQAAGKIADAQNSRLAALEKNPGLVAVMKDMGDVYYRQFDPATAWMLWDRARSINPRHPVAAGITVMEDKLRQDHPDFF